KRAGAAGRDARPRTRRAQRLRQYERADRAVRARKADCSRAPRTSVDDCVRTWLYLCGNAARTRMIWPSIALLAFVTLQRLIELPIARANTSRLLASGGYEVAPGHYPLIVALH